MDFSCSFSLLSATAIAANLALAFSPARRRNIALSVAVLLIIAFAIFSHLSRSREKTHAPNRSYVEIPSALSFPAPPSSFASSPVEACAHCGKRLALRDVKCRGGAFDVVFHEVDRRVGGAEGKRGGMNSKKWWRNENGSRSGSAIGVQFENGDEENGEQEGEEWQDVNDEEDSGDFSDHGSRGGQGLGKTTDAEGEERGTEEEEVEGWRWDWRGRKEEGSLEGIEDWCPVVRFSMDDARRLLRGSWIVIAGDSQARLFLVAILRLLLPSVEPINQIVFKRHSNFHFALPEGGITIDFFWSPYAANITDRVNSLLERSSCPDLLFVGAGLWDLLWVNDDEKFGEDVSMLQRAILRLKASPLCNEAEKLSSHSRDGDGQLSPGRRGLLAENLGLEPSSARSPVEDYEFAPLRGTVAGLRIPGHRTHQSRFFPRALQTQHAKEASVGGGEESDMDDKVEESVEQKEGSVDAFQGPPVFWIGLPRLVQRMLSTERKRGVMTEDALRQYKNQVQSCKMLAPSGPCFEIDFEKLTRSCGIGCTKDGMHYNNATYNAAIQGALNLLTLR